MHLQNDSVNVREWSAASQILHSASQLVEEKDWHQGSILTPEVKLCMATALELAWRQAGASLVDMQYASLALSHTIGTSKHIQSGLSDVPYWGAAFVSWNDEPVRTKKEVVSALVKASHFAEEKRKQALEGA